MPGPYRKPDGRWVGYALDPATGQRRWATGRTRTVAAQRLRDLEQRLAEGVEPEGTVGAWLDRAQHAPARGGKPPKPTTLEFRRTTLARVPGWFRDMAVERVRPRDVERALAEVAAGNGRGPLSGTTVARTRSMLVSAFDRAVRQRAIAWNPAAATDPVAVEPPEHTWLDRPQAAAVLDELDGHQWTGLYAVLASVGLRRSEVLGMRWDELDLDAGTITVAWTLVKTASGDLVLERTTKTEGSRRTVPLLDVAAGPLRARRDLVGDASPWVWADPIPRLRRAGQERATPHGLPHPDSLGGPLARACRAAGVPTVTPHELRHSAATIMLAAGVDSRVIMDVLGHDDPRMMRIYQHVLDEARLRAKGQLDAVWGTGEAAS